MMKNKTRIYRIILLLCLTGVLLSGCRVRTSAVDPANPVRLQAYTDQGDPSLESGELMDGPDGADPADSPEMEPGGRTQEDPGAERMEYDALADAQVEPGQEERIHQNGTGEGSFSEHAEQKEAAAKENENGEKRAKLTREADDARDTGVEEDAEKADSALTYYKTLLRDRLGSLFECKRIYVYWESTDDHVTIFKESPEHQLILDAGAYDVSSRLLAENLTVDDGWIERKNPGAIVKVTDASVLGEGVLLPGSAEQVYKEILARPGISNENAVNDPHVLLLSEELLESEWGRVFAELILAKTLYPDSFQDVDLKEAGDMLAGEQTGQALAGVWYYPQ